MGNPLISVIVPVYNVEKYLRRCLDSIINQTYLSLQIILVEDGSPDRCGAICDEYASIDNRITVIHKLNGGVASARNAGLSLADGDWIGWVDSDDWIESDMFRYLLDNAVKANADIAVCSRYEIYKDHQVFRGWKEKTILDTESALSALLANDSMQNFLWDKLWRKELFADLVFPEGHTYEDIAVMHRLFEKAERVICLPEAKYHYLQRTGSIVDNISLGNRIDHYNAARARCDEMCERWPQFYEQMEAQCVASAIGVWSSYCANPRKEQEKYLPQLIKMSTYAKNHYRQALKFINLGITGKGILFLTPYPEQWSFRCARILGLLYKYKHGREL